MKYNDFLKLGFDSYRRWFNQMFSLSLNGKFVGLLRLGSKLDIFINKLGKMLNPSSKHSRPLSDIIVIKLGSDIVKLYNR